MVGRGSHGEEGTAAKSGTHTNITDHMNNVVTILFQNTSHSFFRDRLDLSAINYKKNVGHVLEALLNAIGLRWNASGKCIWWSAEPGGEKLSWRAPAMSSTRKPAEQRATAWTAWMQWTSSTTPQHPPPAAAPLTPPPPHDGPRSRMHSSWCLLQLTSVLAASG